MGNINGDSHDDIIIRDQLGDSMAAWVFYGNAGLPPILSGGAADLIFDFSDPTATGRTIFAEAAGDLNGDGNADVVFATTRTETATGIARNNVYVHSGDTLSSSAVRTPSVQTTFPIIDRKATALAVGQLNDGPQDLLVGDFDPGGGLAYLYRGTTDFISRPIGFVPPPDVILLPDNPGEGFGRTVEIPGNMNDPDQFVEVTSAYTVEQIQPGPNDPPGTRLHLTFTGDQQLFDELHLALAPADPNNPVGAVEVSYLTNQGNLVSVGPRLLELSGGEIGLEGDLDGNGVLNVQDLKLLRGALDSCEGDNHFLPEADFDEDDCITKADRTRWIQLFVAFKKGN